MTWLLETHAHADHLSAAPWLQATVGGRIAIGAHIREVQAVFGRLFNLGADFATDGRPFDQLFNDGDTFRIGALEAEVLHVPGTRSRTWPACGDAVFVGDTLFMPDVGSARCDFPGATPATLFTVRPAVCWHRRMRPGCSCATTIRLPDGGPSAKPP